MRYKQYCTTTCNILARQERLCKVGEQSRDGSWRLWYGYTWLRQVAASTLTTLRRLATSASKGKGLYIQTVAIQARANQRKERQVHDRQERVRIHRLTEQTCKKDRLHVQGPGGRWRLANNYYNPHWTVNIRAPKFFNLLQIPFCIFIYMPPLFTYFESFSFLASPVSPILFCLFQTAYPSILFNRDRILWTLNIKQASLSSNNSLQRFVIVPGRTKS